MADAEQLRLALVSAADDFEKLLRAWMTAPFPVEAQVLGSMSPPCGPFAEAAEAIRRARAAAYTGAA